MNGHKPINLGPVVGHTVREDAQRNPVPEGRGLAVIAPATGEVFMVSRSQAAQAESMIANRSRGRRAQQVRSRG